MIRRHTPDGHWLLIEQVAHAQLAGGLAAAFGNAQFAKPLRPSTTMAIARHDDGWPLHDDGATLNSAGLPLDVFETPPEVAFAVWPTSAERVAASDAYAGLLVSLHQLLLSINAATPRAGVKRETFDLSHPRVKFEFNKFQHREIERQEQLRRTVGLSADRPLRAGLADLGVDPAEDALRFDFRLLQAMDQVSLAACCTELPQRETGDLHPQPGGKPTRLRLGRASAADPLLSIVTIDPWPFGVERIEANVPARRLPARPFSSVESFRQAYDAAERVVLRCEIKRVKS